MKKYLKENMTHEELRSHLVQDLQLGANDIAIEADGTVNVKDNVYIFDSHLVEGGRFRVTFGEVKGSFDSGNSKDLTTLKGCPRRVEKRFKIHDTPNLKVLDFLPEFIGQDFYLHNSGVTSLVGISDMLHECRGEFKCDFEKITEGGLGLIQIKGLKALTVKSGSELTEPFKIISGYLGRPDDIFDCQAELIENGFEDFAQL